MIIVAALPPPIHGQSAATQALCALLHERGVSILIADISPGSLKRGLSYHSRRLRSVTQACKLLLKNRCPSHEVMYTVIESGFGILYNVVLVSIARLCGYTIVLHHHTAKHALRRWLPFVILNQISGQKAHHLALSPAMGNDLRRHYPSMGPVLICHNATFVQPVPVERKDLQPTLCLGFLSNITIDKGVIDAIDVFRCLLELGLSVKLVLAGPIIDSKAEYIVKDCCRRYPQNLVWLGRVDTRQKVKFLHEIDVLLFPTQYKFEAQPLVIIEAMSAGVPVIASDRGYIKELLKGDEHGPVFSRDGYVSAAVKLIQYWLQSPKSYYLEVERQCDLYKSYANTSWLTQLLPVLAQGKW